MFLKPSTLEKLVLTFPKSLVSNYYRVFGFENTEKLLTIFAGMTLRVPSTKDVERAVRDIAIYESLSDVKPEVAKQQRLKLSELHHISCKKVRRIFKRMKRVMRLSDKMKEADAEVGEHKKPKRLKKSRIRGRSKF